MARLIMQLFDNKWEDLLLKVGIKIHLNARYMDDGRCLLQPIRPGWRWVGDRLMFCKRWQVADNKLSPESVTKKVLVTVLIWLRIF